MEAVEGNKPPLVAVLDEPTLSIQNSYDGGLTARVNLQKTLSFHSQYQEALSEITPFLANVEDELNDNNPTANGEEKISRLKVIFQIIEQH